MTRIRVCFFVVIAFIAALYAAAVEAQDLGAVREYRLPNGSWNRPLMQSKSRLLILQRPVGPRNVPYDAILTDFRDDENDTIEIARYKDVATTATIHHADRPGFFTVTAGEATLWNDDRSPRMNWILVPEYFTTDAVILSHFDTIAIRSFNEDMKVFSIWWIDMKSEKVERIVTGTDLHLLSQPETANFVYLNIREDTRRFIHEIDHHGILKKSTLIPQNFLASAVSADGLHVWGRYIHDDRRSMGIAFFETNVPAKVTKLTEGTWDCAEPLVSALGEVAFYRKVDPVGTQHLCMVAEGKVRTIHERLVPGGGCFNWSDSGTELVSIVLDDGGHECVRIDTIHLAKK